MDKISLCTEIYCVPRENKGYGNRLRLILSKKTDSPWTRNTQPFHVAVYQEHLETELKKGDRELLYIFQIYNR